jgi:exosortase F-associated protein
MTIYRLFSFVMVLLLIAGLVAVRGFEDLLFSDPLKLYFQADFQLKPVPALDVFQQIAGTSLRFLVNMVLSLWIIWFLYKKMDYIKASLWVYLFAYLLLMIAFYFLLDASSDLGKMGLFYVRRFLIHPLLLFVLVAGFYFLKQKNNG